MDPFAVFGPNSINGSTCTSFLIYVRSGAVLDVYWAEGLSREPRLVHIGSKDRSARCSRSTPDQRIDPRVVLDPFWIKASSVSFLGSEDVTGLDDPHAAFDSYRNAQICASPLIATQIPATAGEQQAALAPEQLHVSMGIVEAPVIDKENHQTSCGGLTGCNP